MMIDDDLLHHPPFPDKESKVSHASSDKTGSVAPVEATRRFMRIRS